MQTRFDWSLALYEAMLALSEFSGSGEDEWPEDSVADTKEAAAFEGLALVVVATVRNKPTLHLERFGVPAWL